MKRNRTTVALAVVGVASIVGGTPAGAANPTPQPKPGTSVEAEPFGYIAPEVRQKMRDQDRAKAAASQVRWAIERSGAAGYSGIELHGGSVVLWYKGALPQAVSAAVAHAGRTAPVAVRSAAHSFAELSAASDRLVQDIHKQPGGPAHTVQIAMDGSGLVVGVDRASTLQSAGLSEVGVPVRVEQRPRVELAGRLNDWAPFYGGARITNAENGAQCTSGFGVVSVYDARQYILTAGHCGRPTGGWWNGNGTTYLGTGAFEHINHDLLLINASAGSHIFDGGVGSGEFTKAVAGWDWVFGGEWLCTSGSVSGAICNHVVHNFVNTVCGYEAYGHWECYGDLVVSLQIDLVTAARPGDSGGPVFGLSGSRVIAKGTMTAVSGPWLYWQDFGTAWADFGVVPRTS